MLGQYADRNCVKIITVRSTFARNQRHLLPPKDEEKALQKLADIFHADCFTRAIKQYQPPSKTVREQ